MKSKSKNNQEEKKKFSKKLPYIGVCTLIFVGFISILTGHFSTRLVLPSENTPTIMLPSPPPVSFSDTAPVPVPKETPAPPAMPSAEPASAMPVSAENELFQMQLPLEGDLLTPFSDSALLYSKTLSDWRTHPAIDILASSGTEVYAAADGVVEKAYKDTLMGETIVIAHNEQYKTLYQNLASTQMVKEGQAVKRGQVIAVVGNTAPAELLEKTHLHFALMQNDKPMNPYDYLRPAS